MYKYYTEPHFADRNSKPVWRVSEDGVEVTWFHGGSCDEHALWQTSEFTNLADLLKEGPLTEVDDKGRLLQS